MANHPPPVLSPAISVALLVFPFIAGLLILMLPSKFAKRAAFIATLIQAALTGYAIYAFNINMRNSPLMVNEQGIVNMPWITQFGARFFIGLDGISMLMVILTNFLLPLIVLSTWNREFQRSKLFYFLVLMMQGALVGVFVSLDAFLYYIFWELALIPIYFIILLWGGENRVRITFKFFIYTLSGSLLMLAGIIWLYLQTPGGSFGVDAFYALRIDPAAQRWVFWAFFLAFAIKIPLLPFHSWQPDTYFTAPNAGTMLLSGIMLKMGIYSMMRWMIPVVPNAVLAYRDMVIILCIAGIVYASWIAMTQKDLKRIFAWSSIAHVGLITAGLFTLSESRTGFQGALIQMIAHGTNVVGLFFVVEIIQSRMGTTELDKLGGIRQKAPVFASVFMVITFASIALPLTNSFIGEFLLLNTLYEYSYWFAAIAGLTIVAGAVYMLRAYKVSMLGESSQLSIIKDGVVGIPAESHSAAVPGQGRQGYFADLSTSEKLVFFPIVGLIVFFGIYPQFIFNLTDESVKYLLSEITKHLVPTS